MRKFHGFFVLLAGLAFGFFAFYPDTSDRESRLAEITEILAAPAGEVSRIAETGLMRSFAPAHPITIRAPAGVAPSQKPDAHVATIPAAPKLAPVVVAQKVAPPVSETSWQAVVTATDTRAVPSRVTSSTPGDGASRYELVLDIQRELKRAGCYGGTLSGSWTANTKRAMSAFMERVNATLPMDEPDYILLTLIKGQATASCVTCPTGQSLDDGRCVPNAVIAQKKAPRSDERKIADAAKRNDHGFRTTTAVAEADVTTTASIPAPTAAPLPGRMGMGGPALEFNLRTGDDAANKAWETRVLPGARRIPPVAAADPPLPVTPSATPMPKPQKPSAPGVATSKSVIAALEPEDVTEAGPAALADPTRAGIPQTTTAPGTGGIDSTTAAVPVGVQGPGLPGSKSGVAAYGPDDPAAAAQGPRPRAARPRASRGSARPDREYNTGRHFTRSVQNIFMHPLGRM